MQTIRLYRGIQFNVAYFPCLSFSPGLAPVLKIPNTLVELSFLSRVKQISDLIAVINSSKKSSARGSIRGSLVINYAKQLSSN